ncbi:MAG: CDP-6-deoxy-delta-3,4-glucoseen reductase [Halofilum sp. (in: g-proteobacteria)]|nr:CDP-6-deoxy-delta-3,4-glucoseen reductase [Halofilum sp. (in: g-proteobacteria)]
MGHRVTLRPSGHAFDVEAGESILDAALRHGYSLPYGCRNGTCAACEGELLAGDVEYPGGPPPALTDQAAAAGRVILCQAQPSADTEVEVHEVDEARDIVVRTLPVRVAEIEPLAHDVTRLRLRLPAAERLQFLAGQYIDLLLKDGRRRSFSLANPPHDDDLLELHVRRVPGGRFSDELLSDMRPKALLRFEGPLGSFFLREDSGRPIVLVAGGTGFAPIKSIVEHALARGIERPMHLFWGVRARRDLYLGELARRWAGEHAHIDFTPVLSEPGPDDDWDGETGFVHDAVLRAHPDLSGHQVYMSGPPPMIDAGRNAFRAAGLPREELFFDSFDYAPDAVQGMTQAGIDPG